MRGYPRLPDAANQVASHSPARSIGLNHLPNSRGARERRPKTSLVLKHPGLASYIGTGEVRRTHARAGASNHFME
jgi:hypothetical protein